MPHRVGDGRFRRARAIMTCRRGCAPKHRHVAAQRQNDMHRVIPAAIRIVALQRAAQAHRLDAHDRIVLRIEIVTTPERFDGNRIALDAILAAAQRGFDHVAQKRNELGTCAKRVASGDARERGADFFRRGTFVVPGVRVGHCAALPLPRTPFGTRNDPPLARPAQCRMSQGCHSAIATVLKAILIVQFSIFTCISRVEIVLSSLKLLDNFFHLPDNTIYA